LRLVGVRESLSSRFYKKDRRAKSPHRGKSWDKGNFLGRR